MIELTPAQPTDLDAVLSLVEAADLPRGGIADAFPDGYVVARIDGAVVAAAGVEVHGRFGLLRSVAVAANHRSAGLGRTLVERAVAAGRERGLEALYLLTTTAPEYFARLGFERVVRDGAPEQLKRSSEFASICPSSAVCMKKDL